MNKAIKKLEISLSESNRLQDMGSKRLIPSAISTCLNDSKNMTLDKIIDYNDIFKVTSRELYTMGN